MKLALLDTVVLTRDVPEHELRAGDVGGSDMLTVRTA
jgi:hypothetical protein